MRIFFTSFSKTGENKTDSLIFSLRYFRGKLLDFGIDFANVGPIFVKNLLNLSARASLAWQKDNRILMGDKCLKRCCNVNILEDHVPYYNTPVSHRVLYHL